MKISTSNGSTGYELYQPAEQYELSQGELGGCNGTSSMVVTQDYYALKENEICVYQGEVVQVLAINQQNMILVYRPSNNHSPAAEGWIPGSILGSITKPSAENSDRSIKKSCSWHTLRMRKRDGKETNGPSKTMEVLGSTVKDAACRLYGALCAFLTQAAHVFSACCLSFGAMRRKPHWR
ncbi:hypothetical protein FKM82_029760 [Ascaphus truei]